MLSFACVLASFGAECSADSEDSAPTTVVTEPPASTSTSTTPNSESSTVPASQESGPTPPGPPDLQRPEPGRAITFDGAGGVAIGDVLDPSTVTQYETPGSCGYWGPNEPSHDGDEPLAGLVADANTTAPTVRSIMVRSNPRYRTASGVGVGTRLETLHRIYGDDLVVDRLDAQFLRTAGLLALYNDLAAIRSGDRALTFILLHDVVSAVKVSPTDFWGDDEGCA